MVSSTKLEKYNISRFSKSGSPRKTSTLENMVRKYEKQASQPTKRSSHAASPRPKASPRSCSPGSSKKFAKVVNGKCVRFGDPNMTIKSNDPARKRSFCARHKCSEKGDPATAGYQSCKKWDCKTRK